MSLQPERTDLAWSRTALAVCALALLGVRLTFEADGPPFVVAVPALAAAASFTALARWRSVQLRSQPTPPPLPVRAGAAVAVALVVLDAAGLVLVSRL